MKSKSLSSSKTHLRSAKSGRLIARNIATSTSIETGKSPQTYVTRYRDSRPERPVAANNSKSP